MTLTYVKDKLYTFPLYQNGFEDTKFTFLTKRYLNKLIDQRKLKVSITDKDRNSLECGTVYKIDFLRNEVTVQIQDINIPYTTDVYIVLCGKYIIDSSYGMLGEVQTIKIKKNASVYFVLLPESMLIP